MKLGAFGGPLPQVACVLLTMSASASPASAKNCQADSDCGAPAICRLIPYQTCAGKDPACPAGSACGDKPLAPDQPNCATYMEGICTSPWELPCAADADCGGGFHCIEQIHAACMGGGSTGTDGGAPTYWEHCETVRGTFACVLAEQACTEDTDCSTGLSCQQAPSARSCGSSGPAGVDGGLVAEAECAGATKQCAPPGYFPTSSTGSRDATLAGTGEAVDSSEHKGDAGTSNGVTAPPQANGQTPVVADGSATPAEVEDGCAVAVSRSDGGLWFGMLSLALFYQRRRARPPA